MAFKMSPLGKKKCSYKPLQERGLIKPLMAEGVIVDIYDSSTGKTKKVRPGDSVIPWSIWGISSGNYPRTWSILV